MEKRKRPSEGHSLSGVIRGRDLSGNGKKKTERGTLTPCRRQREGLVRTRKEKDRARGTHILETAEGGTCQDTEKKKTERGALTLWRRQREGLVRIRKKKKTERGALTPWRRQREGLSRTWKEIDRARHTHILETAEGGTYQDTERNRLSEENSRSEDSRGRDLSRHGKKNIEGGALTDWRRQRDRLVRTRKETDRARHTHCLETAERGTCQDTERNRPSEAHSRPEDSRGRDLSGHGQKQIERGALTDWRRQRDGLVRTQKETD